MADPTLPEDRPIVTIEAARAFGANRFFTAVPCKYGHLSERFVSNKRCVECSYSAQAEWAKANPEWYRAKSNRWYHLDVVRARARQKVVRSRRIEKTAEQGRKWRMKNPGRNAARARKWAAANPEKARLNSIAASGRRRTLAQSAQERVTAADVLSILSKQRFRCAWCGTSIKKRRHIDHIMPIARGGKHAPSNLIGSCVSCNLRKSSKDPLAWAQELGLLI